MFFYNYYLYFFALYKIEIILRIYHQIFDYIVHLQKYLKDLKKINTKILLIL